MKSAIIGAFALLALSAPAMAVTIEQGVVYITQADALVGGITPGDTAGFPITLSVSGSYRFASNLLVSTADNGIDVTAPEVTIDFAGFRMAGSGIGASGISNSQRALTIRNGTIRGFTSNGIYSLGNYTTIDRMRIVDNLLASSVSSAAVFAINNLKVRDSNISRNGGGIGIGCFSTCSVENSIIVGNNASSIPAISVNGEGGSVLGNTISNWNVPIANVGNTLPFGNNTVVGNIGSSQGTLVPLDPNQPPPPP